MLEKFEGIQCQAETFLQSFPSSAGCQLKQDFRNPPSDYVQNITGVYSR